MNKLLNINRAYQKETFDEVTARYEGFGSELFLNIKDQYPDIFKNLTFYKIQPEPYDDSFAVYTKGRTSFAIQLEPDIEQITLWNKSDSTIIGNWSNDLYNDSINYIITKLLKDKP